VKALVTGDAGFIGRHVAAGLVNRGYSVRGIDLKPLPGYVPESSDWYHSTGDMVDFLRYGVPSRYDLVVHCAYHVGGRVGIDGTFGNLARNVALDGTLFDWAMSTGQGRVLYFSSSASYPVDLQLGPSRELAESDIDPMYPRLPDAGYGWAKLTGERLAAVAIRSGLPVTVVRPFSGYGADQGGEYPWPAIAERARSHPPGRPFVVWGPKGQTRDWIHVGDVVRLSLDAASLGLESPTNLCTGVGVEFGDLARMFLEAFKKPGQDILYDTAEPTGVMYRVGNSTRMNNLIGAPEVALESAISELVSGRSG
jgi:nucleoside-diphosphate-sugar epimerase